MKKSFFHKLFAGITAVLLSLAAAGCTGALDVPKDDSLQKIQHAGQLILGLDEDFPPMGFRNEDGEIVGFDIDMAREVCYRLGVTLVTRGIDWDDKEEELNSGAIDCIWNGLSVTPGRAQAMNLSDPYMKNELIAVVLNDSDARAIRDLKGKKIGVQSGATAQEVLEASEMRPEITIERYNDVLSMLQGLNQREVDAVVVDSVAAYYYIFSTEQRYYILSDSFGEEQYAIGFRKQDQKLRDKIQEIIITMKTDGTLGRISKKWFGSDITTVR